MKITYLGTAAAEGIPAIFCHCELCNSSRIHKKKDIRFRSSALLNDDFLFDISPDNYAQTLKFGFNMSAVKTIAITHTHTDHFYPQQLIYRGWVYAHNMKSEKVEIISNEKAMEKMEMFTSEEMIDDVNNGIKRTLLKSFTPYVSNGYKVTPLPASHASGENAFVYLVEKDNSSILYLHDTGFLSDDVIEYFVENNIEPNLISFDCTGGLKINDGIGHMGFDDVLIQTEILIMNEIINKNTILVINHFSHNCLNTHSQLCEEAKKHGFIVAYDGMTIDTTNR